MSKNLRTLDTDVYFSKTQTGGNLYLANNSAGVYLSQGATSWTANSDLRLKNVNSEITDALGKLNSLRAINYSWKLFISPLIIFIIRGLCFKYSRLCTIFCQFRS